MLAMAVQPAVAGTALGPRAPRLAGGRVLSEEIAEFERGAINFGCVGQRRGQKSGGNSSGCGKGQQPKNAPTRSCSSRRAAAWWCLELSLLADGAPKHSSSFGFSLAAERALPLLRAGAMAAYVSRAARTPGNTRGCAWQQQRGPAVCHCGRSGGVAQPTRTPVSRCEKVRTKPKKKRIHLGQQRRCTSSGGLF